MDTICLLVMRFLGQCEDMHSHIQTSVTVTYGQVMLNNNASVKTKNAEAHDVGELV